MNSAKECVQEYEKQYHQGLRTLPELITAIMRTAGEFGGEETIAHVSEEFIFELRNQVENVPNRDDLFTINLSDEEASLVYSGLLNLNNAVFRT